MDAKDLHTRAVGGALKAEKRTLASSSAPGVAPRRQIRARLPPSRARLFPSLSLHFLPLLLVGRRVQEELPFFFLLLLERPRRILGELSLLALTGPVDDHLTRYQLPGFVHQGGCHFSLEGGRQRGAGGGQAVPCDLHVDA